MRKIKIHILEISQMDVFFFFEPTIVAKTNVTVLQSPFPFFLHWMLINERLKQRETKFFATLQHWIGGKEDNKNIKVDFFGATLDVILDCSLI